MELANAAQMRALDRQAIEHMGIPGLVLMENAGRGCMRVLRRRIGGSLAGVRIGVVCGAGNNGGDGFVIARHLMNRGASVRIYLVAARDKISGDAAVNLAIAERMGIAFAPALKTLGSEQVVIDALLGTGLRAEVSGRYADAIERVNALPRKILRLAVDIPSGLDADTGVAHGVCVRADLTATMALPKVGLVTSPGFEAAGELHVVDISLPRSLIAAAGLDTFLLDEAGVGPLVPARPRRAHKGSFGHLLVIAGSRGKTGAALLCGEAAMRAGAGLVTVASPADAQAALERRVRELMTAPYDDLPALERLLRGKRAVALGPGIPTDPASLERAKRLALTVRLPMVLDADGLNALGGAPEVLARAAGPRLLTPHPGEMARLVGSTTEAVQADRVAVARRVAAQAQAVIVLKGARTVIAAPDGRAFINPTGNPGLATGGTGDVLTGICGALLAQGLSVLDAARLGVYVQGRAADQVAARRGAERGLLARDLIETLPEAFTMR